jgi:tetratricopeptide (TPR) repeat protein
MRPVWLLLLPLAAACSNAPATGNAYQRGVAALQKGDARTARIEFLNAIKADPDDKAARVMQARTYLALGDGAGAEAEVRRARLLGVPPNMTRPLMAHALLLQERPADAVAELEGAAGAYAERMRGRALAAVGKEEQAAEAYDKALELAPSDSELWTDVAQFRRSRGAIAAALEAADRAVEADPANGKAIALRGELTRSQYGLRASLPWFDRAIELDGKDVAARIERAATLGDMGEHREMLAEVRRAHALAPKNPRVFYLQATLAARAGKFALARSIFQRSQGRLAGEPGPMLLAATIDLETGNPGAAARRLSQLLERQPDNRKARRLLATATWRSGDARKTAELLRPLADRPDATSYELSLMGHAAARLGDAGSAARYLGRSLEPETAGALLSDRVGAAELERLRSAAELEPTAAAPQIALIRGLLGTGIESEAIERARALQAAHPQVPDVHVLTGDALVARGNDRAAVEEYRKAANIAFTEPVALRMIDALHRSGRADAAGKVLELFLEQNPRSVPAQLLAAARYMEARRWPGAILYYERLRQQLGDSDAMLLNNLALAYGATGQYARAVPLAKQAWALNKSNPVTTDTLGWLLFKSGARAQGLVLLQRAARGAPSDAEIRAHLQAARKRPPQARS